QAGNTPGGKRDVLRTSGTLPINSPGTCCDPAVGGALALLSAPARVDNDGQSAVPTVISGPAGSLATFTISDGTHTITGTGSIGPDGMPGTVLDLSGMNDSLLTFTLSSVGGIGGPVMATLVKNTVVPGAPGISSLAYIGSARVGTATFYISGEAGAFVNLSVYDGTIWEDMFGYLDANGNATVVMDISPLKDGNLIAQATVTNASGSTNASSITVVKDTVAPLAPTATLPRFVNMFNKTAAAISVSGEVGATVNVRVSDGIGALLGTGVVGTNGVASLALNLSALREGALTATFSLTDAAGNTGASFSTTATKDTVGAAITGSLPAPTNGGFYDVGAKVTLTYGATDISGATTAVKLDGTTVITAGVIDIDTLRSGSHTVVITATDGAGNVSTSSITFVIHGTNAG